MSYCDRGSLPVVSFDNRKIYFTYNKLTLRREYGNSEYEYVAKVWATYFPQWRDYINVRVIHTSFLICSHVLFTEHQSQQFSYFISFTRNSASTNFIFRRTPQNLPRWFKQPRFTHIKKHITKFPNGTFNYVSPKLI